MPDKIPITVVSQEEAEQADYLLCAPVGPSPFTDNVTTVCAVCGTAIMHRPHAPKKPPKVCIECCLTRVECEAPDADDLRRNR